MTSYKIGKIQQLVDLSENHTNFKCTFKIVAPPDAVYNMLVVTQSQLDNDDFTPSFRKERGESGGEIIADKNVQENYFLILKSDDKPVDLEVFRNIEPLPDNIPQMPIEHHSQQAEQPPKSKFAFLKNKYMWIGLAVIVLFVIIYFSFFFNKEEDNTVVNQTSSIETVVESNVLPETTTETPSLLDQLKNMSIDDE